MAKKLRVSRDFYPRPPGGGRPQYVPQGGRSCYEISIHALRVEGDPGLWFIGCYCVKYFYPRPPGGGRLEYINKKVNEFKFLSTPSGWRATTRFSDISATVIFLSTPSGWRATADLRDDAQSLYISIHALRVEGDV